MQTAVMTPEISAKVVSLAERNKADLEILGLMFLRLLTSDMHVVHHHPSQVLQMMLALHGKGLLGTKKSLIDLFQELDETGIPMISDGHGGSILRL